MSTEPVTEEVSTEYTKPTVKQLVTQRLAENAGGVVREKVVTLMVEEEIEKRTVAVVAVVKKLDEATKALKKVNVPDNEQFDVDGKVVSATYSKTKLDDIKKAKELLAKLTKALDLALEQNNFDKVFELAAK
jgi:hypothetical protein